LSDCCPSRVRPSVFVGRESKVTIMYIYVHMATYLMDEGVRERRLAGLRSESAEELCHIGTKTSPLLNSTTKLSHCGRVRSSEFARKTARWPRRDLASILIASAALAFRTMNFRQGHLIRWCSAVLLVLCASPVTAPFSTLDLGGAGKDLTTILQDKMAKDSLALSPPVAVVVCRPFLAAAPVRLTRGANVAEDRQPLYSILRI
jgi:hypothetical protein